MTSRQVASTLISCVSTPACPSAQSGCSAQREALYQALLEVDVMSQLQVLKAVFTGLFTAGVDGICDQQVLVKTTGEQHEVKFDLHLGCCYGKTAASGC